MTLLSTLLSPPTVILGQASAQTRGSVTAKILGSSPRMTQMGVLRRLLKKMLLFLVLMGVGGAQATSGVKNPPQKAPTPTHQKKSAKKTTEKGIFVNLGQFNIPILKENDPVAFVGLEITLEGTSLEAAEILREKAPQIHSSFFVELYILTNMLWGVEEEINTLSLKKRLDQLCEKLYGVDLVKEVLLQNIYVRKLKKP